MTWLLWSGAGLALLCSIPCGLNLGTRVAKGAEKVWSPAILGWAVLFHGALGLAGLALIMQAKG